MTKKATGANYPAVTDAIIKNSRIPLPPLPEQKRIAAILDKADAIRRKRQQAKQLADDFLRSVFRDMFGDPVTNPKGWEVRPLSDGIASITSGWSAKGESYPCGPNDMGVFKISCVTSGAFRPEENKLVHRETIPATKKLLFPVKGDLLFSRANTRELVAASCIVTKDVTNVFLPDKLWKVETDPNIMILEFLNFLLWDQRFKNELTTMATGTSGSMLNISKQKFLSKSAIIPSVPEQKRFKSIFWKVHEFHSRVATSSKSIDESFYSLSQRVFSGLL